MVDLHVGRHGVLLLVVLFLIFAVEDILIWINRGAVPGIEFFLGSVVVLLVVAFVIRESQKHQPPDQ